MLKTKCTFLSKYHHANTHRQTNINAYVYTNSHHFSCLQLKKVFRRNPVFFVYCTFPILLLNKANIKIFLIANRSSYMQWIIFTKEKSLTLSLKSKNSSPASNKNEKVQVVQADPPNRWQIEMANVDYPLTIYLKKCQITAVKNCTLNNKKIQFHISYTKKIAIDTK